MSRLTIYKEKVPETITLPVSFIDDYMKDANDAQIKVYLYLLRMVSGKTPTSILDIAEKFNHTEREVIRALSFWENLGLISIEYDSQGEICGLDIPTIPVKKTAPAQALEDTKEASQRQTGARILNMGSAIDHSEEETPALQEEPVIKKREFSRDELSTIKKEADFSQLLFVTETYFGRPLTMNDLQTLAFITKELDFSTELTDYLIEYCVCKNHRDMRYIEKVALAWKQSGIKTVHQAKIRSTRYEKIVYSVMKALGRGQNDVTQTEADYILNWYHGLGFSEDVILFACQKCVLATEKNRIVYTDGILKNWHKDGLKTLTQIQKTEAKKSASQPAALPVSGKTGTAGKMVHNQYAKRDIDYDSLEKELLKYQ